MSRLSRLAAASLVSLLAAACTSTSDPSFSVGPAIGGPDPVPVVEQRDRVGMTAPEGLYVTCLEPGPKVVPTPTCPVLVYRGRTYWAFAYTNNRSSMALVAHANGTPVATKELEGARYIVSMRVEMADSTVVLTGQGAREVSIRWSELP